ncbi:MAG: class II aldolase/adducin family protein [Candidatus Latescibacteria bacterium]|nr:class II aldolase/adducin family protein [Candidatus Latescibacterota bacterium]
MTLHQAKLDILEAGRRLYDRGYIVSSDGNISARFDEGRLIVTPGGLCKGNLSVEDLCVCDMEGRKIGGLRSPSSEIGMHLFLYRERPDIKAVVHAHPPTATGFSVAGMPLTDCVLPEVVITLGSIPTAKYGTPGGPEISEPIRRFVKDYDAYLLENHGATTVGSDVMNAYFKMETLEHFARILFIARQLGGANVLNQEQVDKLLRIRKRLGIRGPDPACVVDKAPSGTDTSGSQIPTRRTRSVSNPSDAPPPPEDDLITEITRQVMQELRTEKPH